MTINFRVEYDSIPIRHLAVECPGCNKWFVANEIVKDEIIRYEHEIEFARFECPICHKQFSVYDPEQNAYRSLNKANIEKVEYPVIYFGCGKTVETWEFD